MATSTAIALIIATFFLAGLSFFWLSKVANDIAAQVVTGVVGGVPISMKQRRLLLYQTWVNFALAAIGLAAFGVVAVLNIAGHAPEPGVKQLAYLAAFIGGIAVVGGFLTFATELVAFRTTLAEGEA